MVSPVSIHGPSKPRADAAGNMAEGKCRTHACVSGCGVVSFEIVVDAVAAVGSVEGFGCRV